MVQRTSAEVYDPQALIVTSSGNLLFADLDHIRSINAAGTINTIAGNGFPNFFGDGGSAKSAGLDFPGDVAIDAQGNVYIADEANEVVRRIDHATGMITTVAGNGGNAFQDGLAIGFSWRRRIGDTSRDRDPGEPLRWTERVTFLSASGMQCVRWIWLRELYRRWSFLMMTTTRRLFSDGNHTLYLVCGYQVLAFNMQTGASVAMTRRLGDAPSGDGGPSVKCDRYPSGLALDGKGSLYFSDSGNENIRVINLSTGIIETMAGAMNGAAGLIPVMAVVLWLRRSISPRGCVSMLRGHLLITDTGNHAIRQIDLTTNVITTVAGGRERGIYGWTAVRPLQRLCITRKRLHSMRQGTCISRILRTIAFAGVVVGPTVLTSALSASLTNAPQGENISVTATYSGQFFGVAPTGTVTFLDGTVLVGTGNLTEGGEW